MTPKKFRVKMFREMSSTKLESSINKFLEENESIISEVVQIQFIEITKLPVFQALLTYIID